MSQSIVLVTGAAGFIGRHVACHFASKGWEVHGVGRGSFSDAHLWGIHTWTSGNVSAETLNRCTTKAAVIIHCAGGASVGRSVEHPAEDFASTVQSTSAVLEFVRTHSQQSRVIYPSSAAVYGQVDRLPIKEEELAAPISPYGVHKYMAESLCRLYSQQYDIKCVVLRLFSIYGPELRKQLLWDACEKISQGNARFFGTGQEIRDWLYIGDLARLIYQATSMPMESCPILNAASGQGVSIFNILEHVRKCLKSSAPLIFTSAHKAGDPNAMVADISRASASGWQPEMAWRDGVAKYVEWYKK